MDTTSLRSCRRKYANHFASGLLVYPNYNQAVSDQPCHHLPTVHRIVPPTFVLVLDVSNVTESLVVPQRHDMESLL